VVDTTAGWDAIHLKKWTCVKLTRFNNAKCRVLHPGWGNPQYQYRIKGLRVPLLRRTWAYWWMKSWT